MFCRAKARKPPRNIRRSLDASEKNHPRTQPNLNPTPPHTTPTKSIKQTPQRASGGSEATGPTAVQDQEGLELALESEEKELHSQEALSKRREGLAAAAAAARSGSGAVGGGGAGGGGEGETRGDEEGGWEMVADPEVPETCCGFASLREEGVSSWIFYYPPAIHDQPVKGVQGG